MRHLVAVLAALLLLPLLTAPATARRDVDFAGAVSMKGCSGSVVRPPGDEPGAPALVLTNGHCVRVMGADEVVVDVAGGRTFTLLSRDGGDTLGTLRADRLLYATMHGTDVALYRLTATNAQVEAMGTRVLELAPTRAAVGADIRVVSGYWGTVHSCRVDGYVRELREDRWVWRGSVRYTELCDTKGGSSGSPVVEASTGKVVAVNNTTNERGERCTRDNPCEVDEAGEVTVRPGARYGQPVDGLVPCLVGGGRLDLTAPGCGLPRP
ncbi:S1 family peptidase [Saccharothrix sp. Mg75]|uniref:S1 family peptidase n=1 Tax=Saccharothrix sp. Mg75 TaxID=3445357 RepID=UPI003EEEFBFF